MLRGGGALNDKCSLDKLAEAPGSRQLDVGQGKNYHHSQEKEENIEHCPPPTKENRACCGEVGGGGALKNFEKLWQCKRF